MLDPKVGKTLKAMMIGSGIYNAVLFVVSVIAFLFYGIVNKVESIEILKYILKNEAGVVLGFICSIIGLYSMAVSLEKAVNSNDAGYAKSHVTLMSMIRLIVFCILLIIIINEKVLGFVGGILFALATLGVKIGTYLVPIIEKKLK